MNEHSLEETTGWLVPLGMTAGNTGNCRSCRAEVMWVTTAAGKRMPIDRDGKSHFATCPQADDWRRK